MNTTADSLPQLTPRAVILAIILAVVLAAANTYLGLFAGLTIATAIPAAVVSMAVLRAFGGGHILENNIVQTGASAAASMSAGVIFTIPALVLLGHWSDFKYMWVLAVAGLGGVLGVLFSVPLRRSLIIEAKLAFPEGKAAAEVLKAGEDPSRGIKLLAGAAALGAVAKVFAGSGLRLIADNATAAAFVGRGIAYFGTALSPALLAVGYIVGLNIGIVVVAGGIISWNIAMPIYSTFFLDGNPEFAATLAGLDAEATAGAIRGAQIRYMGVGAMLIGGIWTMFAMRASLMSGIRSGLAATRAGAARVVSHTEQDLPMKWVLIAIVVFVLPLAGLYQAIVGDAAITIPMTIIMIIAGFVFASVSAYMAGLIGSSNNPVSGMTICTILFASLVLRMLMDSAAEASVGEVATIMIAAVVCCAASVAGDNLQDLKAGYLVGATPWRQQVMLAVGAVSCALIMAPLLNLLAAAYGIGVASADHPDPLEAPQATLIASVVQGMFGGELPWNMVGVGVLIGAAIITTDEILKARKSNFRTPVLAAAVGIYLPLELTVPIFLGGLLSWVVERATGMTRADGDAKERLHRPGVLFSAGLITGEALMGIVIAFPIVLSGRADVLALPEGLQTGEWGEFFGLVFLGVIAWILYRSVIRRAST